MKMKKRVIPAVLASLFMGAAAPAAQAQQFSGVYAASETVTTSAVPGYYQSDAIGISSAGQQYGYTYSNNVYIPQ